MDWEKDKIEELARLIAEYDLTEVEIRSGDTCIRVKKTPAPVQVPLGYQGIPAQGAPRVNDAFRRITERKEQQDEMETSRAKNREEPRPKPAGKTAGDQKYLTSPIAGIFYRQSQPGNPPYVEIGQSVKKGDTVCLVEAMKMINEITADRDGVVKEFLAENEQFVEYGAPLVLIEEE